MNSTVSEISSFSADAETFASMLLSIRAIRLPVPGLIKSWVGESVSDDGKVSRVFVRSNGTEVDGLIRWTEVEA